MFDEWKIGVYEWQGEEILGFRFLILGYLKMGIGLYNLSYFTV
jgi:hypothetical protein